MTIRERLADLITGGALTKERAKTDATWLEWYAADCAIAPAIARDALALRNALRAIAAMGTPGAAPAAKRMAKVAREALS